jgi:hypothetical protein
MISPDDEQPRLGEPDWFFCGNDELSLACVASAKPELLIGVASPHVLHVLGAAVGTLRQVIIIDINPRQINHLRMLLGALERSKSRSAFVETVLGITIDSSGHEQLNSVNDLAPGRTTGSRNGSAFLPMERVFWPHAIMDGANAMRIYGSIPAIRSDGIRFSSTLLGRPVAQHIQVVACERDGQGFCPGTLSFGCGYLATECAFARTRASLVGLNVVYKNSDLIDEIDRILEAVEGKPAVLYMSNVFHEFFVARAPSLVRAAERIAHSGATLVLDQREPDALVGHLRSYVNGQS